MPFMCPDGTCKGYFFGCKYPQNIRIAKIFNEEIDELKLAYIYDQEENALMTINANTMIELNLRGVSLSEVMTTTLKYDPIYENVFSKFFMKKGKNLSPKEFLRSTIFKVKGINH